MTFRQWWKAYQKRNKTSNHSKEVVEEAWNFQQSNVDTLNLQLNEALRFVKEMKKILKILK